MRRLSFDTGNHRQGARADCALRGAGMAGRVLIKIASTGRAFRLLPCLRRKASHCNLTLLFSPIQAAACAERHHADLAVSWAASWTGTKARRQVSPPRKNPACSRCASSTRTTNTTATRPRVMGASFNGIGEILALAGCDLLTISPDLLNQLQGMNDAG